MTAARSYKKPMAVWAARRELADCAGGQFDPEIVRAFLSISLPKLLWRTGPVTLAVQLPFLGRLQEVGLQSVTAMTQGVAAATVAAGVTAMVVAGPVGASAHGHHARASARGSEHDARGGSAVSHGDTGRTRRIVSGTEAFPRRSRRRRARAQDVPPRGPSPAPGPTTPTEPGHGPTPTPTPTPHPDAAPVAHADAPPDAHSAPDPSSDRRIPLPLPTVPLPCSRSSLCRHSRSRRYRHSRAPRCRRLPIPRPLALLPVEIARHRGLNRSRERRSPFRRRWSPPCSRVLRAMLFPTVDFAIFFCLVFLGHWLLNARPVPWKLFMIGASYVFYAWWDWHFVWLLAGVSVVAQVGGLAVAKQEEPGPPAAGDGDRGRGDARAARVLQVLRLLRGRTPTNGLARLGIHAGPPLIQVVLPVGISFFSFMAVSYIVDIQRRDTKPASWIDLFLYLSFFPHLVAGPIVRAERADPAARHPSRPAARRHRWRGVADLRRTVQEGGRLELPGVGDRRPGVRRSRAPRRGRGAVRGLGVRDRDLRRLQRLHGHRDRRREALGLPVPAELRPAVHRSIAAGLLAPMAHDAQPLAPRLPLHPARRYRRRASSART